MSGAALTADFRRRGPGSRRQRALAVRTGRFDGLVEPRQPANPSDRLGVTSDLASSAIVSDSHGELSRDRSGQRGGATTSRVAVSIRRGDRLIFAGSPRWACRRPMRWRMRTTRA